MFNWISAVVGAVCGAAVALSVGGVYNIVFENPQLRAAERSLVQAEARERALDLIKKRGDDNEEISTFDRAALCRELGGEWVPVDESCN